MSNSVIDDAQANDPRPWWRRTKAFSPVQIAVASLEECRKDQLDHAHKKEYHEAMVLMLAKRETRLIKNIRDLSAKPEAVKAEDPPIE